MNYLRTSIYTFLLCAMCAFALPQINEVHAQDPGDRAAKFRGTWWSGLHPTLLDQDERLLNFKTLDGFGVGFTSGSVFSAKQFAPMPLLRTLPGGEEVFPEDDDTFVLDQLIKVTEAGFMVQAYSNCENFVGENADELVEFATSWRAWCDINPTAQAFINSKPYHRKAGFPDRPYMFCYAEFVLKYHSQQYGQYIDIWVFDDGHTMADHGDSQTSGNVDDQRLFEAFANAARAGNDEIAVAFNNGRSQDLFANGFNSYPFAPATRFDDFTFGHAFGGNNNHADENRFDLNYQHIARMQQKNGFVHDGGIWDWDDKIVGHFFSKLSTTAWNFGPNQAWEQDDFNQWNAEALSAGGMTTWSGSYKRDLSEIRSFVPDMLEACDNYLFERGISVNAPASLLGDVNGDGNVDCNDLDGYVGNMGATATAELAPLDLDNDGILSAADANTLITTLVQTSNGVIGTFPGDLNCDGRVDVLGDAFAMIGNLGSSVVSYAQGDINFDGTTDVLGDAFILIGNLGSTNDPSSAP